MTSKTTVLITGCSPGGIGHALAIEFHNRGCHVIATARRPSVLQDLGDMGMSTVQLDVTDQASVDACKEEAAKITGGRLDILVNNAGRTHIMPALDLDLDDVKATFDANLFGMMRMCKAFSSLLIPARGLIVNESSMSCASSAPFFSAYISSKMAVEAYARCLRVELRPLDVRVMVVVVGSIKSEIYNRPGARRDLPPDSLYRPALDIFHRTQDPYSLGRWTQTDVFAARFVTAALRGQGWLGGWVGGSPEWLREGAYAGASRLAMGLPWCFSEAATAFIFHTGRMSRLIREAALAKQKTA
ncbi:short chain dehydrogenase [Hirsutella rhossiliensis]|uniref:Short chain dehydrogenase domain-containing protein n=1 Tax=Hirsutella rhossiliensis TaxID=111463 RepID=A0A9P8SF20_9HYPO|nr:short chain dehydrogenase domain-containing protein [Hirsutella rhossiliensis]KAH0958566.1 short chain dehydrogenase domain-containing protein [Hirsutella rhossiliensis]